MDIVPQWNLFCSSKHILGTSCIPNMHGTEKGRVLGVHQVVKSSGKEAGVVPPPCWGVGSLDLIPAPQARSLAWAPWWASLHPMTGNSKALSQCSSSLIPSEIRFRKPLSHKCFDISHLTYYSLLWCFKHLVGLWWPCPQSCLQIIGRTPEQGPGKFCDLFQLGQWVRMPQHPSQHALGYPVMALHHLGLGTILDVYLVSWLSSSWRGNQNAEWVIGGPKPGNGRLLELEGTLGLLLPRFASNPMEQHFSHTSCQVITQPLLEHFWKSGVHGFFCPFHLQTRLIVVKLFSVIRGDLASCCVHLPCRTITTKPTASGSWERHRHHGSLYSTRPFQLLLPQFPWSRLIFLSMA